MRSRIPDFSPGKSLLGRDIVPLVKDLVLTFDPEMSFDDYIMTQVSTCMSRLGQINSLKHAFDQQTLITVIIALVFSKL